MYWDVEKSQYNQYKQGQAKNFPEIVNEIQELTASIYIARISGVWIFCDYPEKISEIKPARKADYQETWEK